MKLSEYKIGDRVNYIFLGDYDGTVSAIHQTFGAEPLLSIKLDKSAPVQFNMGSHDVVAMCPDYIELIKG